MSFVYFMISFSLAVVLFFLQNWIGSKTYSKGYAHFSLLDDKEEAVSMNYAIKVFGPIIYLILCVAVFQYYKIDNLLKEPIHVIYYYIGIRLALIILYERIRIVNWFKILVYYSSVVIISKIITDNFIDKVDYLLPDFTDIKNEIWLLIIIFIFQVGNGFEATKKLSEPHVAELPELKKRKKKYILRKYKLLNSKYGDIINDISNNDYSFNMTIISILIYENFNRPRILRFFERFWVTVSQKEHSVGIMQIRSRKPITDEESVIQGVKKLHDRYAKIKSEGNYHFPISMMITNQCPDKKYTRQILFIAKAIMDNSTPIQKENYKELKDEIQDEFNLYN